jgi:ubiquitin-like protein ATG12
MKRNKFRLDSSDPWARITAFLRKALQFGPDDELLCYVRSSFVPSPDEQLGQLYRCFELNGELVVNYSKTAAWG